jgi:hypothetical protein
MRSEPKRPVRHEQLYNLRQHPTRAVSRVPHPHPNEGPIRGAGRSEGHTITLCPHISWGLRSRVQISFSETQSVLAFQKTPNTQDVCLGIEPRTCQDSTNCNALPPLPVNLMNPPTDKPHQERRNCPTPQTIRIGCSRDHQGLGINPLF